MLERLRDRLLADTSPPTTIEGWVDWIFAWLGKDDSARLALLEREKRSILSAVGLKNDGELTADALQRLKPGVVAWIRGLPLSQVEQALSAGTLPARQANYAHERERSRPASCL